MIQPTIDDRNACLKAGRDVEKANFRVSEGLTGTLKEKIKHFKSNHLIDEKENGDPENSSLLWFMEHIGVRV